MRTYLEHDADLIRKCLPAGAEAPEGSDNLFLMYAVLLRAKGVETQASDVHDAWSAWMLGVDPEHESIRPFGELDAETRNEDGPYLVAIRTASRATMKNTDTMTTAADTKQAPRLAGLPWQQ